MKQGLQRCGKGEEVHSVLKSDLAGGRLPSGLLAFQYEQEKSSTGMTALSGLGAAEDIGSGCRAAASIGDPACSIGL